MLGEGVCGLCVVGVVVLLLRMVGVVILRLELGDLHAKPLMALTAIHHDMLSLMALTVHIEWIQRG
jgi:hypothetical protein